MKFTKMQGCGNDYVYVDCTKGMMDDPVEFCKRVSDRHFGVGSDGLILICASDTADFEMVMYNADGSRAEMCGNGIRCVGKYVYDKGLTDKTHLTIQTLAGIKYLDLNVVDGKVETVRVMMGHPILKASEVPVISDQDRVIDQPLTVAGRDYRVTCVSVGNPHCITFLTEDVRDLDLDAIGPDFESHARFPKRVNTEFVNVLDRTHLRMRVYERGTGETLACGTGATATGMAAYLNGLTESKVDIELLGGHLVIEYDEKEDLLYMTGPATIVFEGEIEA